LLIKFSNETKFNAQSAEKFLASRGILVRGMSVYNLPSYLRVSLGTEEENRTLIKELKSFLEN
jgi:histidinol-phosphate aminotransferase